MSEPDPLVGRAVMIRSDAGIEYAGVVRSIAACAGRGELFELVGDSARGDQRLVFVCDRARQVVERPREAGARRDVEETPMDRTLHDVRNQLAVAVGTLHALIDGKLPPTAERLRVVLAAVAAVDEALPAAVPAPEAAKADLLAAVVEGSPYAKILVDEHGHIVLVNSETEKLFGYRRDELLGRSIEMLVPERVKAGHSALRAFFTAAPVARPMGAGRDLFGRRKDGTDVPIEIGLNPVPSTGRTFTLAAITDITERKSTERLRIDHAGMSRHAAELERLNADLKVASRFKTEFVATMSHELRTPLSAIVGGTQLLASSPLDTRDRAVVETIAEASEALLAITNSVLDFSQIEAGKMELRIEPVDLESVVASAADVAAHLARDKPVTVYAHIDPRIPGVRADRDRLRQVFLNLLGNAVKFTDAGHVVIRAEALERTAETIAVRFEVEDDGIGISDEMLPRLFQPFAQADRSASRRFGGTGLGLSICKRLVDLMGGRIDVRSALGRGTTFSFSLSFERAGEQTACPALPDGLRVTIVSDDDLFVRIARCYLESWAIGVRCETTLDDAVLRAAGDERELVIADLDGGRVREALDALGASAPPRVILVGADRPLRKPLRRSQLFDALIATSPDGSGARVAPVPSSRAASDRRVRVLVAEDNEQLQTLLQLQFDELGVAVAFVPDGRSAVAAVERERFSLVFMDCHMPELDGFAATRLIRAAEAERGGHVAIVAMTADAFAEDREACLRAGMDDFLSKPVRQEALIASIRRWANTDPPALTRSC